MTGRRSGEQRADDHISRICDKYRVNILNYKSSQIYNTKPIGWLVDKCKTFPLGWFREKVFILDWSREQTRSYCDELSLNQITKSMRKAGYTLQKYTLKKNTFAKIHFAKKHVCKNTFLKLKSKSSWFQKIHDAPWSTEAL